MRRALGALAALTAYAALTLFYTAPLLGHWRTHALGFEADASMWLWNLWHMRHSVTLGVNPLWTDHQYWPWGSNLLLLHYGIPYGLIAIALQAWMGLTSAYNALMLANIALGGFFVFLIADAWGAGWGAAFFGGALYAFSPFTNVTLRTGVGLEYMSLPPLAAFAWALARLSRSGRWYDAALSALMLSWVWSCNYYYFAVCSALVGVAYLRDKRPFEPRLERRTQPPGGKPLARLLEAALLADGLFLAYTIATRGQRKFGGRGGATQLLAYVAPYLAFWALAAARLAQSWRSSMRVRCEAFREAGPYAAVFGFWGLFNLPLIWTVLMIVKAGAFASPSSPWRGGGNPSDVIQFFIPPTYHPLWGWVGRALMDSDPPSGCLGWLPLAAALWLWRRRPVDPTVKFWFAGAIFSFIISLGPWLKIFGLHTYFPLPFYFLHLLPLFSNIQTGYRLSVFTTLFLGLIGAAAVHEFSKRRRAAWAPAAALALLALEFAHAGFPLYDSTIPPFFHRMGELPDGAVLPVPLDANFDAQGADAGMGKHSLPMHYQSAYRKPRMGGNLGRVSKQTREQMHADAFLTALVAAQNGAPPAPLLGDACRVAGYFRDRRLRYVLARRADVPAALRGAFARWNLREIDADENWTLYEINRSAPGRCAASRPPRSGRTQARL